MQQKWLITTKKLDNYCICYNHKDLYLYQIEMLDTSKKLAILCELNSKKVVAEDLSISRSWLYRIRQNKIIGEDLTRKIKDLFNRKYIFEEVFFHMKITNDSLQDISDVILMLYDINVNWVGVPEKQIKFIEEFDQNLTRDASVLFHNMRHDYLWIGKEDDVQTPINLFFIGITRIKSNVYLSVKCFHNEVLNSVVRKLMSKFNQNQQSTIDNYDHPSFLILQNIGHTSKNELVLSHIERKFLDYSLNEYYQEIFNFMLTKIEDKGYLDNQDLTKSINGKTLKKIKQFRIFLSHYLKLYTASGKNLFLQNEEPCDLKDVDKNQVFSFANRLYKYFLNDWFEDFTEKIFERYNESNSEFKINKRLKNWEVSLRKGSKREFDFILEVSYGNESKVIAVECKKTISNTTINDTINKTVNRVFNTRYYKLIDAYLLMGYFLNKKISFHNKVNNNGIYVESMKSGEVVKVIREMYCFKGVNYNELEKKLNIVFGEIFD